MSLRGDLKGFNFQKVRHGRVCNEVRIKVLVHSGAIARAVCTWWDLKNKVICQSWEVNTCSSVVSGDYVGATVAEEGDITITTTTTVAVVYWKGEIIAIRLLSSIPKLLWCLSDEMHVMVTDYFKREYYLCFPKEQDRIHMMKKKSLKKTSEANRKNWKFWRHGVAKESLTLVSRVPIQLEAIIPTQLNLALSMKECLLVCSPQFAHPNFFIGQNHHKGLASQNELGPLTPITN